MSKLTQNLKKFLGSPAFKRHLKLAGARTKELGQLQAHLGAFVRGEQAVDAIQGVIVDAVNRTNDIDGEAIPIWGFGGPGTAQFVEVLFQTAQTQPLTDELRRALTGVEIEDPSERLRTFAAFVAQVARESHLGPESNLHVGYATCFLTFCWHVLYNLELPVFYGASHRGMKALITADVVNDPEYGSRDLGRRFRAFLRIARGIRDLLQRVNPRLSYWTVEVFLDWFASEDGPGGQQSEARSTEGVGTQTLATIDPNLVAAAIKFHEESDAMSPLPAPAQAAPAAGGAPWYEGQVQPASVGIQAPPPAPNFDPSAIQDVPYQLAPRQGAGVHTGGAIPGVTEYAPGEGLLDSTSGAVAPPPEKSGPVMLGGRPPVDDASFETVGIPPGAVEAPQPPAPEPPAPEPPAEQPARVAGESSGPLFLGGRRFDEEEPEADAGQAIEVPQPTPLFEAKVEGADRVLDDEVLEQLAADTFIGVDALNELAAQLLGRGQLGIEGATATGKTYVARKLAEAIAGDKERVRYLAMHPGYGYEDFVEAPKPGAEPGPEGVVAGVFKAFADQAREQPDDRFVLILDDAGRCDLIAVFGECLSLVDARGEEATLALSRSSFSIPKNLHVILTASIAEESAVLEPEVRRRFHFARFEASPELLRAYLEANHEELVWLAEVYGVLSEKLAADPNLPGTVGHGIFMLPNLDETQVRYVWEYDVMSLITPFIDDPQVVKFFDIGRIRSQLEAAH